MHKIIFFDDAYSLPMLEQDNGEIRFHRPDATEATDGLDLWESQRSTQPTRTTLASWSYRPSATDYSSENTWIDSGEAAPALEDYDAETNDYGDEPATGLSYGYKRDSKPLHKVTLDGFSMIKYKVRYADFDLFTAATCIP